MLYQTNIFRLISVCAVGMLVAACTIIEPLKGSEAIQLVNDDQTDDCELIARANIQVLDKVLFVNRSEQAMSANLDVLAKNEAVKLGGNTIVATGEITDGQRIYHIYRCPGME